MSKHAAYLYLEDILQAILNIEEYTLRLSIKEFHEQKIVIDAVVSNLEIIGEAATHMPQEIILKYTDVPWKEMQSMRNKVIHEYFGIDEQILWQTIQEDIPILKCEVANILKVHTF